MKRFNIYIALVAAVLCIAGCTKSPMESELADNESGKLVSVSFDLGIEQLSNAGVADRTKSRVVSRERVGGLVIELTESPMVPAKQLTKAIEDIKNYWVFQFDGEEPTSKLVHKQYFSSYTPGKNDRMQLVEGVGQLVGVIMNVGADFGNDMVLNSSTYQTLLDKNIPVTSEADLSDRTTGTPFVRSGVAVNDVSEGCNVRIEVRYNIAVSVVNVLLTDENSLFLENLKSISLRVRNVPNVSYYLPDTESEVFPADGLTTIDYLGDDGDGDSFVGLGPGDNLFYKDVYLPVNRRGIVAGTSAETRWKNAPAGATYFELVVETLEKKVMYRLPMGMNLATDYNVKPNTVCHYGIYIGDDPFDENPAVDVVEKGYVGMFGGELQRVSEFCWQYPDRLYVDEGANIENTAWATTSADYVPLAGSYTDGRANTWYLLRSNMSGFPAAKACYDKNPEPLLSTINSRYNKWYLPSYEELLAVYVSEKGYPLRPFAPLGAHASSTAVTVNGQAFMAKGFNFAGPKTFNVNHTNAKSYTIRCVNKKTEFDGNIIF